MGWIALIRKAMIILAVMIVLPFTVEIEKRKKERKSNA